MSQTGKTIIIEELVPSARVVSIEMVKSVVVKVVDTPAVSFTSFNIL